MSYLHRNKKINILFVESSRGFGGSAKSLFYIIKELDKKKFNPILVLTMANKDVHDFGKYCSNIIEMQRSKSLGYKLTQNCPGTMPFRYIRVVIYFIFCILAEFIKFLKILRKNKINILHINDGLSSNFTAITAAKILNIPIMVHIRGTPDEFESDSKPRVLLRNRISKRFVDIFISVNEECVNKLHLWYGKITQKIFTVNDGIDLRNLDNKPRKDIRKELGIDNNVFCITMVANFLRRKGQHILVEAAKEVLKHNSNIKFLLVGKDYDKKYFKETLDKINAENLSKFFLILGYRNDIPSICRSSNVILLPSILAEGSPRALFEAMAMSRPIIGSNIGGIRETIRDGVNGYLFETGNSKDLALALSKLIRNRTLAETLGINGKNMVEDYYDISKNVKKIENVYEKLMLNKINAEKRNILIKNSFSIKVIESLSSTKQWFSRSIPILMYHRIVEREDPYFRGLRKDIFEQQIEYLKNNYSIIPLNELIESIKKRKKVPKNCVAITFDDGYKCIKELVYPILKTNNIPATIFLTVESIDKRKLQWFDYVALLIKNTNKSSLKLRINGKDEFYSMETNFERLNTAMFIKNTLKKLDAKERLIIMSDLERQCNVKPGFDKNTEMLSWKDVIELSQNGFEIGAHTLTHPILSKLNRDEIFREVNESKSMIEKKINKNVDLFCYPNGLKDDYNDIVKEVLKEAGFSSSCTAIEGLNCRNTDLYELKRLYTTFSSIESFRAHIAKWSLSYA